MRDQTDLVIGGFFVGCVMMALGFGIDVLNGGSPITPEIYGPWAYSIPALAWIGFQAAVGITGIASVVLQWYRLTSFAGMALATHMSAIAGLALDTGADGRIVVAGAGLWLGPFGILIAFITWGRAYERREQARK